MFCHVCCDADIYYWSVQAAEDSSWKTSMKDHWSFDSLQSDQGDKTTATLHGIELVDSKDPVFGKVLRFGSGTDKYLRLENYINTGKGSTFIFYVVSL